MDAGRRSLLDSCFWDGVLRAARELEGEGVAHCVCAHEDRSDGISGCYEYGLVLYLDAEKQILGYGYKNG